MYERCSSRKSRLLFRYRTHCSVQNSYWACTKIQASKACTIRDLKLYKGEPQLRRACTRLHEFYIPRYTADFDPTKNHSHFRIAVNQVIHPDEPYVTKHSCNIFEEHCSKGKENKVTEPKIRCSICGHKLVDERSSSTIFLNNLISPYAKSVRTMSLFGMSNVTIQEFVNPHDFHFHSFQVRFCTSFILLVPIASILCIRSTVLHDTKEVAITFLKQICYLFLKTRSATFIFILSVKIFINARKRSPQLEIHILKGVISNCLQMLKYFQMLIRHPFLDDLFKALQN